MTDIELHASQMPLFLRCPASLAECERSPGSTSDAAERGTLIHRWAAEYVEGRGAQLTNADEDEKYLYFRFLAVWEELWPHFTDPLVEQTLRIRDLLPGISVVGTADVSALFPDEGRVLVADWKSGRVRDPDAMKQVLTYILLVAATHDIELKKAYGYIGWLRDSVYEGWQFSPEDINAHLAAIEGAVGDLERHTTGEHCARCNGASMCPAIKVVAGSLEPIGDTEVLQPQRAIELFGRAKAVRGIADTVLAALEAHVSATGPICVNGVSLELVPNDPKRALTLEKARTVLLKHLTQADLDEATSLAVGKVETAIRAHAPHGQKKAAAEHVMGKVEAAGGLLFKDIKPTLTLIRKEEQKDGTSNTK